MSLRTSALKSPLPLLALATAGFALPSTGCGLLLGNVRPVDEKSTRYGVTDLAKDNPAVWARLDATEEGADQRDPEATATEVSDVAFQAKTSPSIVALNSACRPSVVTHDKSLSDLTHELLLGISEVAQRVERSLTVQATPALETTLRGKMNGKPIAVRSVVLRRDACVYDLLYMAPPAQFSELEADFSRFVASLRLK